ncbi:MAG: hypothetical protein FD135_1496 [Comamonadaceae bacterium]|nr:MAG: hypothetical protein FD135_1496 [Comamonadaceae bacterium]
MRKRQFTYAVLVLLSWGLQGCDKEPENRGPRVGAKPLNEGVPVYRLAVHPLHNPAKLMQAYQPLVEYLNSRINGVRFDLEASRDYANFEEKFRQRKPEFLLPNPWQTLEAMKVGYRVVAMAGEAQDFKGIFVVRRDSKLVHPADLRGRSVSYPSPTALAACIMPQYFLHGYGIHIQTELDNRYVGSQESSIMNAYLGQTAAGATWPPPWRAFQKEHPKEAAELKVIWETESLINNSVMVRDDVAPELAQQVRTLLLGLAETAQGKAILAGMETARFLAASDADYDVVRQYVARFEREVRRVEEK